MKIVGANLRVRPGQTRTWADTHLGRHAPGQTRTWADTHLGRHAGLPLQTQRHDGDWEGLFMYAHFFTPTRIYLVCISRKCLESTAQFLMFLGIFNDINPLHPSIACLT